MTGTKKSGSVRSGKQIVLAVVAFVFICGLATADEQHFTSRELAEICGAEREKLVERAHCVAYIAGVLDAYQSLHHIGSIDGPICIPADGISPAAAIDIFEAWYQVNSEVADLSAATIVLLAMRDRFPCN